MADPITREQVERAIAKPRNIDYRELPLGWREWAPDYVIAAEAADDWDAEHAALTRWHAELVAAETPRKVARWDAEAINKACPFSLEPPLRKRNGQVDAFWASREQAIAWGYEIEDGPEPVAHHAASERVVERLRAMTSADALAALVEAGIVTPDGELTEAYRARPEPKPAEDSPERLRERREALGWTTAYAGHWVPWFDHTDVERAESGKGIPAFVARYAAALSAEEARLAADRQEAEAHRVARQTPDPERPAPRFKVGDWVRWPGDEHAWQVTRVTWLNNCWMCSSATLQSADFGLEPASPPAPEVVDVPQPPAPVVKRCGDVELWWHHDDVVAAAWADSADAVPVPLALLRAMLAAIDAQQGGAS